MSPSGMDDTTDPFPLTERIRTRVADPRAWSVMEAAYEVFLQYGVRRASMQDIADRAGMSRAALYLHYKNKADIFEALMGAYFARPLRRWQRRLAAHDDPSDALAAAFARTGRRCGRRDDALAPCRRAALRQAGCDRGNAAAEGTGGSCRSMPIGWPRGRGAGTARSAVGPDPRETAVATLSRLWMG
jgi:AcrR family transcriptional regulator